MLGYTEEQMRGLTTSKRLTELKKEKELYCEDELHYVVEEGEVEGFYYIIKSVGGYPCAYVGKRRMLEGIMDEGMIEDYGFEGDNMKKLWLVIDVHGALTYSYQSPTPDKKLPRGISYMEGLNPNLDWIGWDYAHYGDYIAGSLFQELYPDAYKWTLDEIRDEVRSVIKQLQGAGY